MVIDYSLFLFMIITVLGIIVILYMIMFEQVRNEIKLLETALSNAQKTCREQRDELEKRTASLRELGERYSVDPGGFGAVGPESMHVQENQLQQPSERPQD